MKLYRVDYRQGGGEGGVRTVGTEYVVAPIPDDARTIFHEQAPHQGPLEVKDIELVSKRVLGIKDYEDMKP